MMKKKILVPIMALAMVVAAGVNYKMINSAVSESDLNLSMHMKTAYASLESASWDDVEDFLNYLDSLGGHDGEEVNEDICDFAHGFCDFYDLTGDPVFGNVQNPDGTWAWIQIDDCDGQPNWC